MDDVFHHERSAACHADSHSAGIGDDIPPHHVQLGILCDLDRSALRSREDVLRDDIPPVHADSGHIQQAIIALATNAIDAMHEGGTLTLRASAQMNRIAIEIEDTGIGIPPEDLSKIFEPFFTTKEVGEGTGLGLAVCYGIVTDHGGRLSVRSNVGKGTIFTIYLPVKT